MISGFGFDELQGAISPAMMLTVRGTDIEQGNLPKVQAPPIGGRGGFTQWVN